MSLFAKEVSSTNARHLAGKDPLAYRDALLGNNDRARRRLRSAASAAGWPRAQRAGTGMGLALLQEWDSIVAHVIEVEVVGIRLRVKRIVVAMDCGTAVNPQQVRAQLEGGSLFGLSAALGEKITLAGGRVEQRTFNDYPLLRIREAPQIDTILLDTLDATVGGVGEPPVPGVAPAPLTPSLRDGQAAAQPATRADLIPIGVTHDHCMLDSTQPTQSGIRSAGCRSTTQLDARGNRCCGVYRRFLYPARLGSRGTIRAGTRRLPVGTTRRHVDSNGIPDLGTGRHHVPIGYRHWRADVDFAGEHFRCHRAGLVRDLDGGTAQSS